MDPTPPVPRHVELEDALDFINTLEHSRDSDTEHLPSIAAAIEWLDAHGVLAEPVAMAGSTDLATIHAVRAALREVADAVVLERPADEAAVARVNGVLRARDVPELHPTADGVAVASRHGPDPIADALAHLAERLVEVIGERRVERLRICANDECRWVFYDTSRTSRRRWCDMTTCGNRAKARRHRERLRMPGGDGATHPAL